MKLYKVTFLQIKTKIKTVNVEIHGNINGTKW